MPTGAKLAAAMCLAVLGVVLSVIITSLIPELSRFKYLVPLTVALGGVIGWFFMAPRAGGGVGHAIANGVTCAVALAFWMLTALAVIRVIDLSLKGQYRGLSDAIVAVVMIGAEYALLLAILPVAAALAVGGVVSGFVTNFADRKWS
ncbi:hypothetical protein SAMN04488040_0950 [Sulfitobacter marinus]|uniref:Tellurium resistance protein n=1 Tax=Sulfitobacter marinus TaxID=394264 RepID=A0A1I6QUL9_9RHOB|nr:TrgA family protein [Sulfitobacter marinus]SFS56064.1 hypothetical protein SAMN04488040_0950 [Sulfitobacter marinus]